MIKSLTILIVGIIISGTYGYRSNYDNGAVASSTYRMNPYLYRSAPMTSSRNMNPRLGMRPRMQTVKRSGNSRGARSYPAPYLDGMFTQIDYDILDSVTEESITCYNPNVLYNTLGTRFSMPFYLPTLRDYSKLYVYSCQEIGVAPPASLPSDFVGLAGYYFACLDNVDLYDPISWSSFGPMRESCGFFFYYEDETSVPAPNNPLTPFVLPTDHVGVNNQYYAPPVPYQQM